MREHCLHNNNDLFTLITYDIYFKCLFQCLVYLLEYVMS